MPNSQARWDPEAGGTHREERARGGRGAGGGLRAGAVWGMEVFLLLRGRGAAEDNQDWGPGPPPQGTRAQRHQWGPQDSPAGAACSSAGTRSSLKGPWFPAGLRRTGAPKAHCRKTKAGTPRGTELAGALHGRWGPRACLERGCRAKGREGPLRAVEAVAERLQLAGASSGGQGAVAGEGVEEGCPRPAPGRPWAFSSHPGASPREPGADGTVFSWRRNSPGTCPGAPRPPGTSQPWPGRHKLQWHQVCRDGGHLNTAGSEVSCSPHPHPSQAFFVPCFGNFSLRLFSLVIYYYTSMCLIYPVSPTKMSAPGGWGPPVTATAVPHPTIMPGSCQMLNWVLNDQVNTGSLVTSTTQPRQG